MSMEKLKKLVYKRMKIFKTKLTTIPLWMFIRIQILQIKL